MGANGTEYVCDGAPGADGANGVNGADGAPGANGVSVRLAAETAGANCTNGGVVVTGANGTEYFCDGTDHDPTELDDVQTRLLALEQVVYRTRVFVTSTNYGVTDFDGINGAHALCQTHADSAGLGGTWLAWLSGSDGSPATTFNQSPYNYVLVDGTLVAEDWDDLTDGELVNAITLDENGSAVNYLVWTATNTDGTGQVTTCQNWTSTPVNVGVGRTDSWGAPDDWTTLGGYGCSATLRLYCFEQ